MVNYMSEPRRKNAYRNLNEVTRHIVAAVVTKSLRIKTFYGLYWAVKELLRPEIRGR